LRRRSLLLPGGWLFPGRNPVEPLSARKFCRAVHAAAQAAGARTVLHLHNFRLFCAIAVASRDGGPCFRCRGRFTLPGLVLNCRGSLPEAAAYAAALSAQLPQVLATVDRFVAPSRYAVGQLALLGVPADRLEPLLVKGKSEPVQVDSITSPAAVPA